MNVITSPVEDNEFFLAEFPVPILGILEVDDIGKHLKLDPDVPIDLREITKEQLESIPDRLYDSRHPQIFNSVQFKTPTKVRFYECDFDSADEPCEEDDFEFDMSQLTALTAGGQYFNLGDPQAITGDPDAWDDWKPLNDDAGIRVMCSDEAAGYLLHDYLIIAHDTYDDYKVLYIGGTTVIGSVHAGTTPAEFEKMVKEFMGV